MQFQVKKLEDQLRKFQMDVDSRFQDSGARTAAQQGAVLASRRDRDAAAPHRASKRRKRRRAGPSRRRSRTVRRRARCSRAPGCRVASGRARRRAAGPGRARRAPPRRVRSLRAARRAGRAADARLGGVRQQAVGRPVEARAASPTGPLDLTPPALRGQPAAADAPVAGVVRRHALAPGRRARGLPRPIPSRPNMKPPRNCSKRSITTPRSRASRLSCRRIRTAA